MPDTMPLPDTAQLLPTMPSSPLLDTITHTWRSASIRDEDNAVVYDATVECPEGWSANAVKIFAQKYLRKTMVPSTTVPIAEPGVPEWLQRRKPAPDATFRGELSVREATHRIVGAWTYWGWRLGYFDNDHGVPDESAAHTFYTKTRWLIETQRMAPNSPQWFNTGLHWAYGIERPSAGHHFATDARTPDLIDSPDPRARARKRRDALKAFATAATDPISVHQASSAYEHPQTHACFIQSIRDSLLGDGGIMDLATREAAVFKFGSGSGVNLSPLRGKLEPLSGGGQSSGALSFAEILDAGAGAIQSGGTTRRAAKMFVLDADHPDVEAFIDMKVREEQKAAFLVIGARVASDTLRRIHATWRATPDERSDAYSDAIAQAAALGIPSSVIAKVIDVARQNLPADNLDLLLPTYTLEWNSETYRTVGGQNANNSLRVTNRFMNAVFNDQPWDLIGRATGAPVKTIRAKTLWEQLGFAAWSCADPGVQFHTTINEWNTCAADGEIVASNPCAEYMFLDDTACNLAHLRLTSFVTTADDGCAFDVAAYNDAIDVTTTALDITNSMASFPSARIARQSLNYRTIGLGHADLGGLLITLGIPYDSDAGRTIAAALTSIMTGRAYARSAQLAAKLGPFPRYTANARHMQRVIAQHQSAAMGHRQVLSDNGPRYHALVPAADYPSAVAASTAGALIKAAQAEWSAAVDLGATSGYRNAHVTCLAPTATTGIVLDADTLGIEPPYALAIKKTLAGGGVMHIASTLVDPALRRLGYTDDQRATIHDHIRRCGTAEGAPVLDPRHAAVFLTAVPPEGYTNCISSSGHILMMAALQPHISGAISKTANVPRTATVEDCLALYETSWREGVKAIALYRDNSKYSQPLVALGADSDLPIPQPAAPAALPAKQDTFPRGAKERLPTRAVSHRQTFKIGGMSYHCHVGEYPDGRVGELFISTAKEGSATRALLSLFGQAISIALQHGVPLDAFVEQFTFTRFEPDGVVQGHDAIKLCTSPVDAIFRHLGINYLGRTDLGQVQPEQLLISHPAPAAPAANAVRIPAASPAALQALRTMLNTTTAAKPPSTRSGELCGTCGGPLERAGACLVCRNCLTSSGGCS